jgi:hypothetical protein
MSFRKKLFDELGSCSKYRCDDTQGLCKLTKCPQYSTCDKKAKKNLKKWKGAYRKNQKSELEKMAKGGFGWKLPW